MELVFILPWDGMKAAPSPPNGMPRAPRNLQGFGQEEKVGQHFVACGRNELLGVGEGVFIGHVRGYVRWRVG